MVLFIEVVSIPKKIKDSFIVGQMGIITYLIKTKIAHTDKLCKCIVWRKNSLSLNYDIVEICLRQANGTGCSIKHSKCWGGGLGCRYITIFFKNIFFTKVFAFCTFNINTIVW